MTSPSSEPSRADDWDTLRREIGPITEPSNDVDTYYAMPPRLILGIDPATLSEEDWEPHGPIWVIPDDALEWGYLNRHHVYAGGTMVLPAHEQEWRDNQHYRAYVRPTKEEA